MMRNVIVFGPQASRGSSSSSKRQRQREKDERKRRTRQQKLVLDRLQKLAALWWRPEDCLRTRHAIRRSEERQIGWHDFTATWRQGEWTWEEDAPEYFIATWGRCRIVITFFEETPILVTAIYVEDQQAA